MLWTRKSKPKSNVTDVSDRLSEKIKTLAESSVENVDANVDDTKTNPETKLLNVDVDAITLNLLNDLV